MDSSKPLVAEAMPTHAEQCAIVPTVEQHDHSDHEHAFDVTEALRIGAVALAAVAVWFQWWEPWSRLSVIGVLGLLIGGWPIYKEAVENLLARRMTMELSMTIAIVAAAAISEFFTALVITAFVLAARVLGGMTGTLIFAAQRTTRYHRGRCPRR